MESPQLGCQRLELQPLDYDGAGGIVFGLDFNTFHESSNKNNFWDCLRKGREGEAACVLGRTQNTGKQVFSGFSLKSPAAKEYFEEEKLGRVPRWN